MCSKRIAVLSLLLSVPVLAAAAEHTVVLDPKESAATFTLGTTFHEVHGTMPVIQGTIRFDLDNGTASGEITVDARAADTGNRKRDKTMHAEVLETEAFPTIVFRMERIEGGIAPTGPSEFQLVGVLTLHGAEHPVTVPATAEIEADHVRGAARFTVPYVEWGLHDPSFLIARAEKTVEIVVEFEGTLHPGAVR